MQHEAVRLRPSAMPLEITGSLLNRFQSKIDKSEDHNGCWKWTAAGRGTGYGCLKVCGTLMDTHVLAWRMAHGGAPVPSGFLIQHSCDNRWCVNHEHLSLGTKQSNYDDMVEKGRRVVACGDQMPNAVLSDELVREIRRLYVPRRFSYRRIAKKLGLKERTVEAVISGQSWRHVQ